MHRTDLSLVVLLAAALASCNQEGVVRIVSLAPTGVLPTGSTLLAGNQLRVDFTGVEALQADSRYVLWVQARSGQLAIGEVMADMAHVLDVSGVSMASVDSLAVSEEGTGSSLPALSSGRVRLVGAPGGPLSFADFGSTQALALAGQARIEDDTLTVEAGALPAAGRGLAWTVWGVLPLADAAAAQQVAPDGHDHAALEGFRLPLPRWDAGHNHGGTGATNLPIVGQPLWLGRLDTAGRLELTDEENVLRLLELVVTLEADAGVNAMSPTMILRGAVTMPQASGSEPTIHSH